MLKLICINENGIAYVENDSGEFGIVNSFKVLDEDGLTFEDKSVYDIFSDEENYHNGIEGYEEANVFYQVEDNGESYYLVITEDEVFIVDEATNERI